MLLPGMEMPLALPRPFSWPVLPLLPSCPPPACRLAARCLMPLWLIGPVLGPAAVTGPEGTPPAAREEEGWPDSCGCTSEAELAWCKVTWPLPARLPAPASCCTGQPPHMPPGLETRWGGVGAGLADPDAAILPSGPAAAALPSGVSEGRGGSAGPCAWPGPLPAGAALPCSAAACAGKGRLVRVPVD